MTLMQNSPTTGRFRLIVFTNVLPLADSEYIFWAYLSVPAPIFHPSSWMVV